MHSGSRSHSEDTAKPQRVCFRFFNTKAAEKKGCDRFGAEKGGDRSACARIFGSVEQGDQRGGESDRGDDRRRRKRFVRKEQCGKAQKSRACQKRRQGRTEICIAEVERVKTGGQYAEIFDIAVFRLYAEMQRRAVREDFQDQGGRRREEQYDFPNDLFHAFPCGALSPLERRGRASFHSEFAAMFRFHLYYTPFFFVSRGRRFFVFRVRQSAAFYRRTHSAALFARICKNLFSNARKNDTIIELKFPQLPKLFSQGKPRKR